MTWSVGSRIKKLNQDSMYLMGTQRLRVSISDSPIRISILTISRFLLSSKLKYRHWEVIPTNISPQLAVNSFFLIEGDLVRFIRTIDHIFQQIWQIYFSIIYQFWNKNELNVYWYGLKLHFSQNFSASFYQPFYSDHCALVKLILKNIYIYINIVLEMNWFGYDFASSITN